MIDGLSYLFLFRCIFPTGCLVLLAAGFLTNTFRYIPKATLAGVILCAMYYMLDFETYLLLWRARSKSNYIVLIILPSNNTI